MGNAYTYRMPSGIPGAVSREENKTIETRPFDSNFPCTAYGIPVKLVGGLIRPIAASDTNSNVWGFLVRPFPTTNGPSGSALGTSVPPTSGMGNVLRRGYMSVQNITGTPADQGAVYTRTASASGSQFIGDIEATNPSGNGFSITAAVFTSAADASGNVEIAYNI